MRRLFLLSVGIGALAALLGSYAVRRLALTEWRGVQREYNERQRGQGLATIVEGIRAVDGPRGPERCVTCHLGTVLPDAHASPFQAHPALSCTEPMGRLGCVGCHRGEPLALTRVRAHGLEAPFTTKRLLPPARRQAGCASSGCHRREVQGALRYDARIVPDVARGLELFIARGCPACHRLDGVHHGSEAGPRLAGVGARLTRAALLEQLRRPAPPMPPVDLPPPGLERLVLLLQAQTEPDSNRPAPRLLEHFPPRPRRAADDAARIALPRAAAPAVGALWARRLGCPGCHRLGPGDSGVPDLRHVAWTTTAEELRESLREPGRRFPGTRMPPLEANDVIFDSVLQYLELQRVPLPSSPSAVLAEVCARCHGKGRDPRHVVLARRPPILEGGPLPSREAFIETASRGRKGSAMAAWGRALSPAFLGQIYELLRASAGAGGGR